MAGKHRHRRGAVHAHAIPVQRRPGIELVDARTRITHRVSSEAMLAGRLAGLYKALCGARVLVASMTDQGCRDCARCAR